MAMLYGVILNDRVSLAKLGATLEAAPYKAAPKAPVLYVKPENTRVGNGARVTLPAGATSVEVGVTVGVVLARSASRLTPAEAAGAIGGYVLVADLSLPHDSYYRPAVREKCFDGACPMALLVPATAVAAVADLTLRTEVDGRPLAPRAMNDLVRDVPQLLADVTEFMTLQQGDILLLGVEYQAPKAAAGSRVYIDGGPLGTLEFSLAADEEGAA